MTDSIPVNNNIATPRYIQIAEQLILKIESGELAYGTRLPPERDLSHTFGVNRMTLRQALGVLEARGLLTRIQGSGTFVARPRIERMAGKLYSFTSGMQQRGYQPSARIIFIELRQAEEPTSKKLELATGAQIIYSHRLRLLNNEPVMLEQFALPAHRLPGFSSHDLCNRSIYEIMNTEYGIKIARAWQSLEPVIASPYEASLLEIQPGAPLMLERRIAYDENGSPVQYSKDLYRGDRFRFITDSAPLEGY